MNNTNTECLLTQAFEDLTSRGYFAQINYYCCYDLRNSWCGEQL